MYTRNNLMVTSENLTMCKKTNTGNLCVPTHHISKMSIQIYIESAWVKTKKDEKLHTKIGEPHTNKRGSKNIHSNVWVCILVLQFNPNLGLKSRFNFNKGKT